MSTSQLARCGVLIGCVIASACGHGSPDRPSAGSSTAGSAAPGSAAADPWQSKPTPPKPPDTPESRAARADAALGRVAAIMPKLAKLRQLDFLHDIPRQYQTTDDFRSYVHAEIAKELPAGKAADYSTALYQLGLLKTPKNLAELEEQAFVTQAGAYYDPKTKKFFLVMVPDNALMLDTVSAHELTHGLQDQHFDLLKYLPDDDGSAAADAPDDPKKLDEDAESARHFVVEGDATFTMFLYAVQESMPAGGSGAPISPKMIDLLGAQLAQFAKMSPEEIAKMNSPMADDPDLKKAADAMADIPATVLVPMTDSYMQGAVLVLTAYKRGGWAAVNDLFAHPPASTEQVLHPDTKYYPQPDPPRRVHLPKLAGAQLAKAVLGELQWQVYFSLWDPPMKATASEGWGGDQVSVVRRADGRLIARIATAWDSPNDATEFAQAYAASLTARFAGATGDATTALGFARPDGTGKIFMETDGDKVYVIDGADSRAELAGMIANTKID